MILTPSKEVVYPDSDGKPMAENTEQFRWISTIKGGLQGMYIDRPDVFVAGDLFWYPVEGDSGINAAPDAMVVFGRPPGPRGSYKQFEEEGIPPQVVFEVLSPSNTPKEMDEKRIFYETYGVDEYYVYDPLSISFEVWKRSGRKLRRIRGIERGYISPLLNVKFELGEELIITGPDGREFKDLPIVIQERNAAIAKVEAESKRADAEAKRANQFQLELEKLRETLKARGIEPPV